MLAAIVTLAWVLTAGGAPASAAASSSGGALAGGASESASPGDHARVRHCGTIVFSPHSESGIRQIVARGVRCRRARAVARAAEPLGITHGPYRYRARGFTCSGWLDDRYLPTVHWLCARRAASVRFVRA